MISGGALGGLLVLTGNRETSAHLLIQLIQIKSTTLDGFKRLEEFD
jgi:hypothetical protein